MNYMLCPHYEEMKKVLADGRSYDDISFELEDIDGCVACMKSEGAVCSLVINLAFVIDMKWQLLIEAPRVTIDTLDDQFSLVVMAMLASSGSAKEDDNNEEDNAGNNNSEV